MQQDELVRHLELARQRAPGDRVFAFQGTGVQPIQVEVAGDVWDIVLVDSELAFREALLNRQDDHYLALVTRLATSDLSPDVRARIAKTELFAFDPWESLKVAFHATRVDGRLRRSAVLGRALLHCGATHFPASLTGVLSADEAWAAYFAAALKLDEEPTETEGWARWMFARQTDAAAILTGDQELFEQLLERAVERCGPTVRLLFRAAVVAVHERANLELRLHAVAHAVLAAFAAERDESVVRLLMRLEAYFGDERADEALLRAFAEEVVRIEPGNIDIAEELDPIFLRAGEGGIALHSDVSGLGYRARLGDLAEACTRRLNGELTGEVLHEQLRFVESHQYFTRTEPADYQERVRSLVRLANRLGDAGATVHPRRPADLAIDYIEEQCFIDALREELEFGDLGIHLAGAARAVLDAAHAHSTERNRLFAEGLVAAIKRKPTVPDAFFTSEMLSTVLAPLVKERPVLVLVLDGLSWFVLRRLSFDPAFDRWVAAMPAHNDVALPMFATLPSVTEYSRCSLLTGVLQRGGQHAEKTGFASSPALIAKMRGSHKAVLFHKGELDAEGTGKVGAEVVDALHSPKYRAVAVVINGVDDQLGGAEQLSFQWTIDTVPPLRSLLELAKETNRDVLIVSDHGHVWRGHGQRSASSHSARYRTGEAERGEASCRGPIIEAFGEDELVLPYDETIRYTGGRRGYHGGVSLQEVVAPCVLLTSEPPDASRWRHLPLSRPAWWDFREEQKTVRAPEPTSQQVSLFAPATDEQGGWVDALLRSKLFMERRARHASVDLERVRSILLTLQANDNRAHVNTLAAAVELPARRVDRMMPTVQQLLNIDGVVVLDHNRSDQIVSLDLDATIRQFQLEGLRG